ncbi:MAG: dipeptidase PepE [Mucinivorans sp.]
MKNLLLISNSANAGEGYLEYPKEAIHQFLSSRRVSSVLFVPYAGVTVCWIDYTAKVRARFAEFGVEVVGIHDCPNAAQAVRQAEAIVVGGGNSFALLKTMQDNGIMAPIKERVEAGVPYIGWSAGSNMACPGLYTTNDMPIVEPQSFKSLKLIPFQINPHYTYATIVCHGGETREQRIEEYLMANKSMNVVGLREGSILLCQSGHLSLIGQNEMRLFRFAQVPRELSSSDDLSFLLGEI